MTFSCLHMIRAVFFVLTVLNCSISAPCTTACQGNEDTVLTVSPPFLIVPVGTEVVFRCEISCRIDDPSSITWLRSDEGLQYGNGFTLRVAANESINVSCSYRFGQSNRIKSKIATLTVITECPKTDYEVKTKFQNSNQSLLNLQFSPPCLWPGHDIDKFNISIESRSDESDDIYNKTVSSYNSTRKTSESLIIPIGDHSSEICSKLFITIMAFDRLCGWLSKVVTKTVGKHPLGPDSFKDTALTTRVFFGSSDDDIIVKINFEIPGPICSFQEVEYNVTVYNANDKSTVMDLGPFEYVGSESSKIASLEIESGLEKNMDYLIKVLVRLSYNNSGPIIVKSDRSMFNTDGAISRTTISYLTILTVSFLVMLCLI